MKKYDLAIIGSGSGLMVMEAALSRGLKCALIEKSKFGGTCLTKGCIPSKMLVYPADLIRETQDSSRIGLTYEPPKVDWDTVSRRMWKQINYSDRMGAGLRRTQGLDVYEGAGRFTGPHTIEIVYEDGRESEEIHAERIVVAAGARSWVPPVEGLNEAGYLTYESFFGDKFPAQPWKSLVIVGGGAIGAEFAHIFSAFGTKVHMVEMQEHILSTEEEEISVFVEKQFRRNRIELYTGHKVVSAAPAEGGKTVTIENVKTGQRQTIAVEEILFSAGLTSNGDFMALDRAGIETDRRGYITTNGYMETSQPHIYAIGDINGLYQFRHTANYEATLLIQNLFGGGSLKHASYDSVPWAIFTWPQVAHVGMTEREAREKGLKIGIARNYYSSIAGGIAMGYSSRSEDNGFVKIILTPDMRVVGAHVVGPYAAMLVQPFVYLMNSGTACQVLRTSLVQNPEALRKFDEDCQPTGSVMPIADSMVIHPSMNELTAWAIEDVEWVN